MWSSMAALVSSGNQVCRYRKGRTKEAGEKYWITGFDGLWNDLGFEGYSAWMEATSD